MRLPPQSHKHSLLYPLTLSQAHTTCSKSFSFSSQRCGLCQRTMATLSHSTNLPAPLWHQQNSQIIDTERRRTGRNQRVVECGKQSNYTFLMSQWNERIGKRLCFRALAACGYNSDYMFLLFSPSANEAGETPLDIARRLKHLQCEELVSSQCLVLAYARKHIKTMWEQSVNFVLYVRGFVCVHSWIKRWQGNSTPTSTSNMNGACSTRTWMKAMKIWMRRWEFINSHTARWEH